MSIGINASNIRGGENPPFSREDFLLIFPQFENVPASVTEMYIEMANKSILESRWHSKWKLAISLYIAHFLTLWAKTSKEEPMTPAQLAVAGESKGAILSKSVDGVSVSYSATSAENDLQGWGSFKDTLYGQQFASLAKFAGFGGMYVI